MSSTRARIKREIHESPGIHFSQLGRELDLATGQVQYHVRQLMREGDIVAEHIGGKRHFYHREFDQFERATIAFLRRETPRELLWRLYVSGPMQPITLAEQVGIARSTVAWHVDNLHQHGIVEKSDDTPMTVSLVNPERMAAMFDEVDPALSATIVDRFMRTVDELFD